MCALDYWIAKIDEWSRQRDFWLLSREFDFPELKEERLNAPGKPREIIRNEGGRFTLGEARWGFERPPGKNWEGSDRAYNARSETVHKLPLFEDAFKNRRCLLVGTSFCEYADQVGGKLMRFSPKDGYPYAYAGLWKPGRIREGELVCTMLTTSPNGLIADFHSRMPVILNEEHYETWLDPESDSGDLKSLLVPDDGDAWRMELAELPPRQTKYEKAESAGQDTFSF